MKVNKLRGFGLIIYRKSVEDFFNEEFFLYNIDNNLIRNFQEDESIFLI